eukprot:1741182-Prymnesium_polylepis.2
MRRAAQAGLLLSILALARGACPSWCTKWTCDGSLWCKANGTVPAPCDGCQAIESAAKGQVVESAAQTTIFGAVVSWSVATNLNCWPGHGAEDIDADGPVAGATTLATCKAICAETDGCEGVVVLKDGGTCYRKTAIELTRCSDDGAGGCCDTHVLLLALPPPPPLAPSPPAEPGRGGPMTPVRAMFDRWYEDTNERFWSMWGGAYMHRFPNTEACWDWDGDPEYWQHTFEGAACERNWLAGAVGSWNDRPFFDGSPALLGFDETINEFCSGVIGVDAWDGFDLNLAIANRCRDARRNVLRDLQGAVRRWQLNSSCSHCALCTA